MTYPATEVDAIPRAVRLERMTGASAPANPAATEPSDAAAVARAIAGDATAIDLLVRRHYCGVFSAAFAVTASTADAEDVCHDTLVRALSRLHECRQPGRFAHWVAAMARNRARNLLAAPSMQRRSAVDPRTIAAPDSPAQTLERDELGATLERAMSLLTDAQREVVLLHDLYEMPHDEIAGRIGTSAGMSRQHLFKARRQLRAALGPDLLKEYFDD